MIGRESGRGTGDGSRVQSVGFLGHASPAVDGGSTDTEDAGDRGRGFALFDEFDGAATAAFEFSRCSFGSHTVLYARPVKKGIFLRAGLSKIEAVTIGDPQRSMGDAAFVEVEFGNTFDADTRNDEAPFGVRFGGQQRRDAEPDGFLSMGQGMIGGPLLPAD